MKANFWFFARVMLVVMLVSLVVPFVNSSVSKGSKSATVALVALLVTIVFYVLQVIVNFGLIRIALKFADGQKPELRDLFETKNIVRYVAGGILYFLIVIGGVILFVIPGIVWGIKYQFYPYFVVQGNATARESIRESGRITLGAKWDLFVFGIVVGLINLLGILALGIGLFATIPATMIAAAFVFRKLQSDTQAGVLTQESAPVN